MPFRKISLFLGEICLNLGLKCNVCNLVSNGSSKNFSHLYVCVCTCTCVLRERQRLRKRKQIQQMLASVESKFLVHNDLLYSSFNFSVQSFKDKLRTKFLRKLAVREKAYLWKNRSSFIPNQSCYCNRGTSLTPSPLMNGRGSDYFTLKPVNMRMWQ